MDGEFAPESAETAIEHLEDFITDIDNDGLPPWFIHVMQGANLLTVVKTEAREGRKADHRPVVVPNTLSKIAE